MTDEVTSDLFEEIATAEGIDVDAFRVYCEHIDEEPSHALAREFSDVYEGEFGSEEEFAEWLFDSLGEDVPDMIRPHIDWSSVWHCELRHDYFEAEGHYFRSV